MHACARSLNAISALLALSILCPGAASAQSWPSRPITLIAAFPPNTTTNYGARAIAQELSAVLVTEDHAKWSKVITAAKISSDQ